MVDLAITTVESDSWNKFRDRSNFVWLDTLIGYYFQLRVGPSIDFADGCEYFKTTDAGVTWSDPVTIFIPSLAAGDTEGIDVWWDKWTPGNTGAIIHIVIVTNTVSTSSRLGKYFTLNTVNDALTEVNDNIRSATMTGSAQGRPAAITQTEDGTLYTIMPLDLSAAFAHELWRSTDSGLTWSKTTEVTGIQRLRYVIYPTASADDKDVLIIFWSVAGDDAVITHAWDDSASAFTTAELGTTGDFVRPELGFGNIWSSTFRQSDKTTLVAIHEDVIHGSHDLRFFTVIWNGTILTVAEKTKVFTAQTHGPAVAITLNNNNNHIYVAYSEGTLGSVVITMVKSIDGGTTWGAATQMSDDDTTYRSVWMAPQIVGPGRIHPLFAKDATGTDTLQFQFLANTFILTRKAVGNIISRAMVAGGFA